LTTHPDFKDNMLSENVLKIDVCRYLEENWPLNDESLERIHKLYRLVAHHRCSCWVSLLVCIQRYENSLRRQTACTHILNTVMFIHFFLINDSLLWYLY
jgi:hypothetical protein